MRQPLIPRTTMKIGTKITSPWSYPHSIVFCILRVPRVTNVRNIYNRIPILYHWTFKNCNSAIAMMNVSSFKVWTIGRDIPPPVPNYGYNRNGMPMFKALMIRTMFVLFHVLIHYGTNHTLLCDGVHPHPPPS